MMLLAKEKISSRISWIIFILITIQMAQTISAFTDVPPPPIRPERFHSREELKRYLQLVHEYYAIIGRPRFGRSQIEKRVNPNHRRLSYLYNTNGDKSIPSEETHEQFENK